MMATTDLPLLKRLEEADSEQCSEALQYYRDLNNSLGGALKELETLERDVLGREDELMDLARILLRPESPVALLIAEAGAGKSALVEEFAKRSRRAEFLTKSQRRYSVFSLHIGILKKVGEDKMQAALATLLANLHTWEKKVIEATDDSNFRLLLFIDEVHTIVTSFGTDTKQGGDVLKESLARTPIAVAAATTQDEYDSTIAVDPPLAQRFKPIEMRELPGGVVHDIADNWWEAYMSPAKPPSRETIDFLIQLNHDHRPHAAEPRRSLDIMDDLAAFYLATGEQPDKSTVETIFSGRFNILLGLDVEIPNAFAALDDAVKGQPYAKYLLKRLIRSLKFRLDPRSNKPLATVLLTGPTGVGKTLSARTIAQALYPDDPNALVFFNMPDFANNTQEPEFRKRLGETLRHNPHAVILFDEVEKAGESLRMSLLSILDEGTVRFEVVNREGRIVKDQTSLRNSIVFATTNAGAKIFSNDAKFSLRELEGEDDLEKSVTARAELDDLIMQLRKDLEAEGFPPELLGRFSRIIPFRSLEARVAVEIATKMLGEILALFSEQGIDIVTDDAREWTSRGYNGVASDIIMYVCYVLCNIMDSDAGGARAIKSAIEVTVLDELNENLELYPESTEFKLAVDPNATIYDERASKSKGGIRVEALN